MNPHDLAATFAPHLGLEASSLEFVRYSQNFVFRYHDGEAGRILRITSNDHRTRDEITAELAWIRHLQQGGAAVCAPAQNPADIITATCGNAAFHAVVFEKAPGRPVQREDLRPELYRTHGRTLGTFHRTATGVPSTWASSRRRWDDERYFDRDISAFLAAEHHQPLKNVFARLRSRVCSAPCTDRTFGPVHFDLGYSNFFVNEDRIAVFDFDNCTASYFLGDIAAALYGSIFTLVRCEFRGDRSVFEHPKSSSILEQVLHSFREGYTSVFEWPDDDPAHLQSWLDLLYFRAVIHACRLQASAENPQVRKALDADIENLLTGKTPVLVPA